jgi:hypothetical protein
MEASQVVLSILCIRRELQPLAQIIFKPRYNSAGEVFSTGIDPNLSLWITRDPPLQTTKFRKDF